MADDRLPAASGGGRSPRTGRLSRWVALVLPLAAASGIDPPWPRAAGELGWAAPGLSAWASADGDGVPNYRDHALDGRMRASHPRILLPQLAGWDGKSLHPEMRARQAGWSLTWYCDWTDPVWLAACWLHGPEPARFARLAAALRDFRPVDADVHADAIGNAWELALAYDLARAAPLLDQPTRDRVEARLRHALAAQLLLLESPDPSLWHGRASLAASAWIIAVALGTRQADDARLAARAQGHFLDAMRALALTEAWPEGYSYWINNRAFVLTLAAAAYLNGLEGARRSADILALLDRAGLWPIHAQRPDHRIEGLGDEGPRVDLKDETQRVVDLMATLTGNPVFVDFSRRIEALHGTGGYYTDYRWGRTLLRKPELFAGPGEPREKLPTAAWFGRGALDLVYIRSGWGADDTFISHRAGKTLTHHAHYDAGHFTLFKGAPLAVTSGVYSGVLSGHRNDYAIRTVAKNALLVMRPGEIVRPNRLFRRNVADGGQRLVMPTGSAVPSVAAWLDDARPGGPFEGARITAFEHRPGQYTYVASDLTAAYETPGHDTGGAGGKVARVTRELFYLEGEDRLIVHDDVLATQPGYVKKWLLHSVARPALDGARVLRGHADDGILESPADTVRVSNGPGRLVVQRLLPRDGLTRLVGGEQHRFYVEDDGDDSDLDGFNAVDGIKALRPWFDVGLWRLEFQPSAPASRDHFLVVLSPSLNAYRTERAAGLDVIRGAGLGAVLEHAVVLFADPSPARSLGFTWPAGRKQLHVLGLPAGAGVRLLVSGWPAVSVRANAAGVISASLPEASGRVELSW